FRNFAKPRRVHDETKCGQPDFAFADVSVPINTRATCSFGIVQMNCYQSVPRLRDNSIELAKCLLGRVLRADVVTGSKNVSSIEANADPFGLAHIGNNVGDVLEAMAEA